MRILILVLSCQQDPYLKMVDTAIETWDSVEVEDIETIYYFGNPVKENTYNKIYFPIEEGYFTMGKKALLAYEWVLNNKEFDYIARVHSSIYVDKKRLKEYVGGLPKENLFAGVETDSQNGFRYCWGGVGYIISRDVIQRVVDNKESWDHTYMEDESLSKLVFSLGIQSFPLKAGAIDRMGDEWRIISYNGESISFKDFNDLIDLHHHHYRVKCDGERSVDKYVMEQLFKVL